jgi:hypothetical protein
VGAGTELTGGLEGAVFPQEGVDFGHRPGL